MLNSGLDIITKRETAYGKPLTTWGDVAMALGDMTVPGFQMAAIDSAMAVGAAESDRRSVPWPLAEMMNWNRRQLDSRLDPQEQTSLAAYLFKNVFAVRVSRFRPDTQVQLWKSAPKLIRRERREELRLLKLNYDSGSMGADAYLSEKERISAKWTAIDNEMWETLRNRAGAIKRGFKGWFDERADD